MVLGFAIAIIAWGYWLEPLIFGNLEGYRNLISNIVVGVLFWIYLIIDIYTMTRQAVKRYLHDFDKEHGGT